MQKNKLKIDQKLYSEFAKLTRSMLDEKGHEVPNPKPTDLDVGLRPPSLQEQIQRLVRTELSKQVQDQGAETFEEANDLDVPEDDDPISPYVIHDMQEEEPLLPDHSAEGGTQGPEAPVEGPETPKPTETHTVENETQ